MHSQTPRPPLLACLWRYPLTSRHAYALAATFGVLGACAFAGAFFLPWSGRPDLLQALFFNIPSASVWGALGLLASARHAWLWFGPSSRADAVPLVGSGFANGREAIVSWIVLPGALAASSNQRLLERLAAKITSSSPAGATLGAQLRALPWLLGVALVVADCAYALAQALCFFFSATVLLSASIEMLSGTVSAPKPGAIAVPTLAVALTLALWILAMAYHAPWRAIAKRLRLALSKASPNASGASGSIGRLIHAVARLALRGARAPFAAAARARSKARSLGAQARERVLAEGRASGVYAQAERQALDESTPGQRAKSDPKRL